MPTVPRYDSLRVGQTALQPTQARAAQTPDVAGQQMQQLGRALDVGGRQLAGVALDLQQQANQLRVDDALNRVKENALRLTYDKDAGFSNLKGINALERPGGKPLADEYAETLQGQIDEAAASLGNDAQRAAFSAAAGGILANFRGQIVQHEAGEFQTYALSTSEGIQSTAMREIGLSWNNPEAIDKAVQRIRAETYRQAQLLGKSAEWQEAQVRKMTSSAHKTALAAALESGDPGYADQYLRKFKDQLEADDLLQVRGLITREMDLRIGNEAGAEVFARYAPRFAGGDFERLAGIVMGIESNGRDFAEDGSLLTSPKGAQGRMQVMPATAADPGYGIRPAADSSPDELARVGREKLAAMLARYDGDVGKALAAYNWGEGNVDNAVKAHGEDWLQQAPAETRNYVERGTREYSAGLGQPRTPTLAEMKAELRSRPELAASPERLRQAEARLEADHKAYTEAIQQREDEALDGAYRSLYANGGDFAALPASLRAAIPGAKLGTVMEFARKLARGEGQTTEPGKLDELLGLPVEQLAGLSLERDIRPYLSPSDFKTVQSAWLAARKGDGSIKDRAKAEAESLERGMAMVGIRVGNSKDALRPDNLAKQDQFRAAYNARRAAFVATQGRDPSPDEAGELAAQLGMDIRLEGGGWFGDSTAKLWEVTPEQAAQVYIDETDVSLESIPVGERASIARELRNNGVAVSEPNIVAAYLNKLATLGTRIR